MSREELLYFEKYQQLEAEGVFVDERSQYLLSVLCRAYILYLASKGGGSNDELTAYFSCPSTVQMRMPTEEELKKIQEQKIKNDRNVYRGLLALASGAKKQGVKVKTMSMQEYLRRKSDVKR